MRHRRHEFGDQLGWSKSFVAPSSFKRQYAKNLECSALVPKMLLTTSKLPIEKYGR